MRSTMAGLLGLILPGAGQAYLGRRRAALLFFVPTAIFIGLVLVLYAGDGGIGLLAVAVTPGVLPVLALVNIGLAAWRLAGVADAVRGTTRPRLAVGVVGTATLLFVIVPHVWLGWTIAATNDYLNAAFAPDVADATAAPEPTLPPSFDPFAEETDGPMPSGSADPGPSAVPPAPRPTGPFSSGAGTLPPLGVAVPWTRPGTIPWGDDGRFDLLLLGSDAGPDRWSRRMDTMLLVEIDVATGKVAMIGLPRNLLNAPFPPGAAHDAVACGCFPELLNALYVEATFVHPNRWPGTGAVKGIGAVRSEVSFLTGRPIDAVLVADLWGMIKVVDAMGGVDIDIPAAVSDQNYPDPLWGHLAMSLPAGQQHLDGRNALFYARSRHQDSDYGRMQRQQTMLLAIRRQIGPGTILDAPDLFAAAKGFTWTDLPRSSAPALVSLFGKAQAASVRQLRLVPPTYPEWLTASEVTKIRQDIASLLGLPVPTPTPSPSPSPAPSAAPTAGPSGPPTPGPSESPEPSASPP
jgi:LCP family protein required for cell wall assembly